MHCARILLRRASDLVAFPPLTDDSRPDELGSSLDLSRVRRARSSLHIQVPVLTN